MKTRTEQRSWFSLAWKVSAVVSAIVLVMVAFGSRLDYTAEAATTSVNVGEESGNPGANADEFNANSITIDSADSVSWQWYDGDHNVRAFDVTDWGTEITDGGNGATVGTSTTFFDGAAPDTYEVSFTNAAPGVKTIWYYCSLHANVGDIDTDSDGDVDGSDSPDFGKMIGRIDVNGPPDVTGPVTVSAAASPNPTNGAGSTTLTATVDDTGAGSSNIIAAEYFLGPAADPGEGNGIAMLAADASFDSATENVNASISLYPPANGTYTVYVRGQDSGGYWGATDSFVLTVSAVPADAEDVSFTLTAGSLSLTTEAVDFGTQPLTGADLTMDVTPPDWVGTDATGLGLGWNVTVSSTDLTTTPPGGTITVDNLKLQLLDVNIVNVAGNAKPVSQVTSYQPLSGAPSKILSAAALTGMGTYTFPPDFRLNVPAASVPGVYGAFLTVTIISGP